VAVIVVVPAPTVVTRPELFTVATEVVEEFHVTPLTKSWLDPSLYVAVAVYCWLMPMPRVKPTGVTEIELIVGAVTVRLVELLMLPRVAEMFVEPAATAVTKPFASTVATAVEDEPQVTSAVRSRLLPSL